MEQDLLGLPLAEALEWGQQHGISFQVVETGDMRNPRSEGTSRVVRVRGNELTVARFCDGLPKERCSNG